MSVQAEDLRVLVCLLRQLRNCTEKEMAAATGLHPGTIRRYETGFRIPRSQNLETIAKAAAVPMSAVDGLLLPVIAAVRGLMARGEALLPGDTDRLMATAFHEEQGAAAAAAVAEFMVEQDLADGEGADASAVPLNGLAISDLWLTDRQAPTDSREPELERYLQFERICVHLCEASAREAANDAAKALMVARLALGVAELAPGDAAWRSCLEGTSWGFISNAQRVGSDLPAADTSFVLAWNLWRAGAVPKGSALSEWRLQDLEASLLRDHRHFAAALGLLERALSAAPVDALPRILLKKAATLEQEGNVEASLAVLQEATPLVDGAREPRLLFGVHFNLAVLLCHLGRHVDSQRHLADLERLAAQLGNGLDIIRVRWLSGRVAAGLGRRDQARAAFAAVQRDLAERDSAYDAALVSMEIAILELEDERTAAVRTLAEQMLWIFRSQVVHREALAALSLFQQAVETDTVTTELARTVLVYLERSRHNVQLTFHTPTE